MAIVGAVGTLVALATGVLQLLGTFRSDDTPIAATIKPSNQIEPDVQWGRYYDRHRDLATGPFSAEQLDRLGDVVSVELKVDGLKGKTSTLRWREVDRDGTGLDVPAWVPRSLPIRPNQDVSRLVLRVWVPVPPRVDEFRVEFSFEDHEGVIRATELSRTIRIGLF